MKKRPQRWYASYYYITPENDGGFGCIRFKLFNGHLPDYDWVVAEILKTCNNAKDAVILSIGKLKP